MRFIFLFLLSAFCLSAESEEFKTVNEYRKQALANIEIAKIQKLESDSIKAIQKDNTEFYLVALVSLALILLILTRNSKPIVIRQDLSEYQAFKQFADTGIYKRQLPQIQNQPRQDQLICGNWYRIEDKTDVR